MFTKSAAFYDAVYAAKDYAAEAERVDALIKTHVRTSAKTLLDVACGTGGHLAYLKHHYVSEGLISTRTCSRSPASDTRSCPSTRPIWFSSTSDMPSMRWCACLARSVTS